MQAEELRRMRVELLEVDRRAARLLADQASEALAGLTDHPDHDNTQQTTGLTFGQNIEAAVE